MKWKILIGFFIVLMTLIWCLASPPGSIWHNGKSEEPQNFAVDQADKNTPIPSGVGEMLNITYSFANVCSWDFYQLKVKFNSPSGGEIITINAMSNMLVADGNTYNFIHYSVNEPDNFAGLVEFYIDSPSNLKACAYKLKYVESGGALETDDVYLRFYKNDGGYTQVNFPDSDNAYDSGIQTLGSNYIIDGRIFGTITWVCTDNSDVVDALTIKIDQLAFIYEDTFEEKPSTIDYWDDELVKHITTFTPIDYGVNVSFDQYIGGGMFELGWIFHSCDPNCTASIGQYWVFSNLQKLVTYTVVANATTYRALSIESSDWTFGDISISVYIKPSLDCSYIIYENDTSQGTGNLVEEGTSIAWARDSTVGVHIRVGIKTYYQSWVVWLNMTYDNPTITDTTMHFAYYMADGSPMLFHSFKTYIDSNRLPPETPWYTTSSSTVNFTVTDVWGDVVYQNTSLAVAEFVDVVTTSYWLTFTNQRDYGVNATIEHNNRNWTIPDAMGYGGGFSIIVYTGSYTIWVWRADSNTLEDNFPKTKSVTGDWSVYTEKTIDSVETPSGWTLDLRWLPLFAAGGIIFAGAIIYDRKYRTS